MREEAGGGEPGRSCVRRGSVHLRLNSYSRLPSFSATAAHIDDLRPSSGCVAKKEGPSCPPRMAFVTQSAPLRWKYHGRASNFVWQMEKLRPRLEMAHLRTHCNTGQLDSGRTRVVSHRTHQGLVPRALPCALPKQLEFGESRPPPPCVELARSRCTVNTSCLSVSSHRSSLCH